MTALFESIDIHGAESVVIDAVLGVIEEEFHRMVCFSMEVRLILKAS